MIRITKIINKGDLFDYMSNPEISKVEMLRSENKTLFDKNRCKVRLYLSVPYEQLNTILGDCQKHKAEKTDWKKGNECFIGGVGSTKHTGFIRASVLNKIIEISKEEKINISVPKSFIKLINKYQ